MSEPGPTADVPEPLALHEYFSCLDDFAAGKPCRSEYVGAMLADRDFGPRESSEWITGRDALWKLIPPINLDEVKEVDLDPAGMIALGLAVVLWGRHGMHHWDGRIVGRRMPAPLPTVERVGRFLAERLEASGRKSTRGGIGRLDSLRQDLQELRGRLEADARGKEKASDGVHDGLANARRKGGDRGGLLAWLPRRLRRATEPGIEAIRSITEPGLRMLTGEIPIQFEWATDPQVPEPLGLYEYVQALDEWAADQTLKQVFLYGLLQSAGFDDAMRVQFRAGRNGLWSLVPPISATQVAEVDLSVDSARSLALALVLRSRHALHHYLPEQPPGLPVPAVLAQCGEVLTALKLILDSNRSRAADPIADLLPSLAGDLAQRGISAGGGLDLKRDAIREGKRQSAQSRRDAEVADDLISGQTARPAGRVSLSMYSGGPLWRLVMGLVVVGALAAAVAMVPSGLTTLPDGTSYKAIPAVAIIRHQDEIRVRIPKQWLRLPQPAREKALRDLHARFAKEMKGVPLPVVLQSLTDEPYGGIAGERVWWDPRVEAILANYRGEKHPPTPTPSPH